MFTEQLTQALSIPATPLLPDNRANNATPYAVGPIDMSQFKRVMAIVNVGVLTGSATVTAYFQACTVSNGTFANITGANNLTVLVNTTETLEMRADQLPAGNRYLQLAVLIAANSAFTAATVLGGEAPYKPADQYDVANTVGDRLVM